MDWMGKLVIALAALLAWTSLTWTTPTLADEQITQQMIWDYAKNFMQTHKDKSWDHLNTSIILSEKIQTFCSFYFYVNFRAARQDYLYRVGTWMLMFSIGKSATMHLNEATNKINEELTMTGNKREWCESVKARGIEQFGWGPLFVKGEEG
jgi:hypothetical protein